MLVNLYHAKTPIAVFSLPLLIGLLAVPIFFYPAQQSFYFWEWQNILDAGIKGEPIVNYLITVVILSVTAHQINNVYNRHSFYSKASFLPGLIYVLSLFALDQLSFSPVLIAHLFLVFALGQILKLRRQDGAKTVMFWGSVFLGMAVVFSFFSVLLVLLAILSLAIFRPFIWREWFMVLLGMLLPLFYYTAILYIVRGDFNFNIAEPATPGNFDLDLFLASSFAMFALVVLGSIFRYFVVMRTEINRFKKQSQVLFHFVWIAAALWAVGYYGFDHLYLSFLIPLSFLIATPMLHAKNNTVANGIVIIWLIISAANVLVIR